MVQRKTPRLKCAGKTEILEGGVDAQHCTGADTHYGRVQPEAQVDAGEKYCGYADFCQVTVPP